MTARDAHIPRKSKGAGGGKSKKPKSNKNTVVPKDN